MSGGIEDGSFMLTGQLPTFSGINTIIERDSKDTTYKFALLVDTILS